VTDPRLDALARTFDLSRTDIAVGATIFPGTLVARTETAPRANRSDALDQTTLPRLEGKTASGGAPDLELISVLGQGGMGAVWLGRQRSLDRPVAVKRLRTVPFDVADAAALLDEARTTGALAHPAIVPVYALGLGADGSPLLVMKPIEGASLDALARDAAHPAWPELERRHGDRIAAYVEILMRVADALQFAHSHGFVHRDVKPENVMVGAFGEVYLLDWGVALARARIGEGPGAIAGTPVFMAPEMARGAYDEIDERTDVYLLGATLHTLLTGAPRHPGTTLHAVLLAALLSEPIVYDASVPVELALLANRATSRDRASRPESAVAMRDALAAFLRHRASRRLATEAERLLSVPNATDAQTAEARFGFTMALREWPENAAARDGLSKTLVRLAELEIARASPEAARALADQLDPRDEALDARIAALVIEVAKRRELEQAARDEAHERDPRVASRQRVALAVSIAAVSAVLAAAIQYVRWTSGRLPSIGSLLAVDLAVFVVFGSVIAIFRARLLANRWGRHASAFVMLGVGIRVLTDLVGVLHGDSLEAIEAYTILALAGGIAVGGLALTPRLFWAGGLGAIAAIATALWPSVAVPAVAAMLMLTGAILVDASRGGERR
jgi:hypothetical protein